MMKLGYVCINSFLSLLENWSCKRIDNCFSGSSSLPWAWGEHAQRKMIRERPEAENASTCSENLSADKGMMRAKGQWQHLLHAQDKIRCFPSVCLLYFLHMSIIVFITYLFLIYSFASKIRTISYCLVSITPNHRSLYLYKVLNCYFKLFIYLRLAVLGLCGCTDFSLVVTSGASCYVWFSHWGGFSCCGAWA